MSQRYKQLLQTILEQGQNEETGAALASTGKFVGARSIFGYQANFGHYFRSVTDRFPAITTKKLFFRGVTEELLWFLRGSTNVNELKDRGVNIWNQWANEKGELGPTYGSQWRNWTGSDGQKTDQVANLLRDIKAVKKDPHDRARRRMILTAWNPPMVPLMHLPPCHLLSQFSLSRGNLSVNVTMRSCDAYLGLPWNIASYALLLSMLAHCTGTTPMDVIFSFGDLHIYENHFDQVDKQLGREPLDPPQLLLNPDKRDLFSFTPEDIVLLNYNYHPALPGEIAILVVTTKRVSVTYQGRLISVSLRPECPLIRIVRAGGMVLFEMPVPLENAIEMQEAVGKPVELTLTVAEKEVTDEK